MKAKLTKKCIDRIELGKRDIFLWDTDLPMFGCKITPKGRRVFVLQYRVNNRLRRYTIGQLGPLTPDEARREAIRLLGEVASGRDPSEMRAVQKKAPTVAEMAERYLNEHALVKKKPRSIDEDEKLLKNIILPTFVHRKISDISRADVSALHFRLRQTPYQANRTLALLSKMFNLAESWGIRSDGSNPCRHVERYKEKKRERFLSPNELARLGNSLNAVQKDGSVFPSVVTAIRLLILTGARLSEILELKWEYVDFERNVIVLPDSKTGPKTIPLGMPATDVLNDAFRIEGNPHVCPGKKPGSNLVGIAKAWKRITKRSGLEDLRIHDLRHSFASVGASAGLGLPILGALLGHSEANTTARYAHLADDPLKAAAEQISSQIASAMKQRRKAKVIDLRR